MKISLRKRLQLPGMMCVMALVMMHGMALAQQVTVRGTVLDDDGGAPLPGATVLVKGSTLGTSTDLDGEFQLPVPNPNDTLQVSFIGYLSMDVPLNGRSEVIIRLQEDVAQLTEVVVVGYGTQRRADVTGSVVSVSPQRIEEIPITNITQALQGSMAGVSVTQTSAGAEQSGMSMLIRGQNSITASNSPLIVVDGIPFNGSLSEINQSDVQSIEILKDASSAAIYGARGSNGIILITTKKGRVGKPRVNYDAHVGVQNIAHLPRIMNGPEFGQFKCDRIGDGENCEAVLTPTEYENWMAGNTTDWVDMATRQGMQMQHNLSFTGGTADTRYYVAGSMLDVAGIARGDDFKRYTLRLNLDQTLTEWLQIGTSTNLAYTNRGGLSVSFSNAFNMNPLTNAFDENGEYTMSPWPEDSYFDNPLLAFRVIDDDITRRVTTSNFVEIDLPFIEGLSYRMNAGIDYATGLSGRYWGRNTKTGLETNGRLNTRNDHRFDWTLENLIRYQRAFGKHFIDFTGLYSAQKESVTSHSVTAEGFPNDVLTYYQADVGQLIVPSASASDERVVSQMGRINYNYDSRYLLTLTARRDGYSGFGENNKYGLFPSVALGWNVALEDFWPLKEQVNNLKLRVSVGENGNQAVSPYHTMARLAEDHYVDGATTLPGYRPSSLANPNLKWETTTSANFGLDFGLFNGRVNGTLDYYKARTRDLLLSRTISPVHGITSIVENIGKTANTGIELMLSTQNIETPDFSWTTEFNISSNRNEIVDLYGDKKDDVANRWFIGKPIHVNYALLFDGIWQEGDDIANSAQPDAKPGDVKIKDMDGDGDIDADDRTFIGRRDPLYIAGLANTFRYKNLSLYVFMHTVQGITISNSELGTNQVHADVRLNMMLREWWTPDNPINTYPRNSNESNPRSIGFYRDKSFVRLKDVTLSYEMPRRFVQRIGLERLRLYVNGRNLWTWTDWEGLDPELSNQTSIPLERQITGGVNLSF